MRADRLLAASARPRRRALAAGLLAAALAPWPDRAGASEIDTLRRIAETGTISLGHRESSVPFSYYDQRHQVVGYSHELMLKAVEAIKTELRLPALTIKLVPVTAQNRIPLVQNGTVDLECGSTSHNLERESQAAFSTSIFVVSTRLLTRRESGIRDFADLAGRAVVVTAGTTSDRLIRLFIERTGGDVKLVVAKDHAAAFDLLQDRRADAFMLDDALLYGLRSKAARPEDWVVVGTPMSSEAYACMMRLGDARLKRIVDAALTAQLGSGEAMRLQVKWFQRPIPPNGLNLAWPPSDDLLRLYRAPNDRPL